MNIVELNLCNYCSYHCKYCVAKTRQSLKSNDFGEYQQNGSLLPMEQALMWLAGTFDPADSRVILTGGEPTIIPFGHEWANRLVAMGYDVYVLTNGTRLMWDSCKWTKQAKYLLTHHIEQVEWDIFEHSVKAMIAAGHKNITLQTIITPQMIEDNWELEPLKERLGKFGFPVMLTGASKYFYNNEFYGFHDERYWDFEPEPKQHEKELHIWSVRPSGDVHICHSAKVVGNIYTPLDKKQGVYFKCFDTKSGFTTCSVKNTILYMREKKEV